MADAKVAPVCFGRWEPGMAVMMIFEVNYTGLVAVSRSGEMIDRLLVSETVDRWVDRWVKGVWCVLIRCNAPVRTDVYFFLIVIIVARQHR